MLNIFSWLPLTNTIPRQSDFNTEFFTTHVPSSTITSFDFPSSFNILPKFILLYWTDMGMYKILFAHCMFTSQIIITQTYCRCNSVQIKYFSWNVWTFCPANCPEPPKIQFTTDKENLWILTSVKLDWVAVQGQEHRKTFHNWPIVQL